MYFSPFLCITYFKKNIWKQTACTCFFMKTAYFLLTQYGIIIFWLTDVRFFYSYLNMNQILPWNPGRLCIMQLLFRTKISNWLNQLTLSYFYIMIIYISLIESSLILVSLTGKYSLGGGISQVQGRLSIGVPDVWISAVLQQNCGGNSTVSIDRVDTGDLRETDIQDTALSIWAILEFVSGHCSSFHIRSHNTTNRQSVEVASYTKICGNLQDRHLKGFYTP